MRFGTWNIQGIRTKETEVIREIEKMNMDIVILTETKKKGEGIEKKGRYIHIFSGVPKEERAKRGVAVLIKEKYRQNLGSYETIDERIIKVNIKLWNKAMTILGIYAPNEDAMMEEKERFYEKLQEVMDEIENNREILLMGDFNGRVGSLKGDKIIGNFGEDTRNDNGERIIDFCRNNEMKVMNGFFKHRNIHKYTWTQHTKQLRSIIDYVIIKQKTEINVIDVIVVRGAECGSDHYLLIAKILFPANYKYMNHDKIDNDLEKLENITFNTEGLADESTKRLYQNRLNEKLKEENFSNTTQLYEYIKDNIKKAAGEALGIREYNSRKNGNLWWDKEMEETIQQKKRAYLKWNSSKTQEDRNTYKEWRGKVRKMVVEKRRKTWDNKCREIETYIGGRRCSEAWKFINNIRKDNDGMKRNYIPIEKWEEYYKNLLTENRSEFMEQNEDIEKNNEVNIQPTQPVMIGINRVKRAIKKLNNNRASGPGGIQAELVKNGTESLFRLIAQLCNRCINGEKIPEEWKMGYMTSIFKKGDRTKCENYRGIAVTSTFSRIYGKILKELIEEEYGPLEAEEQNGFRAGRSCMDNIFSLKQIIEKKTSINKELYLVFVDLTKAYDTVPIKKLWSVLEEIKINHTVIKALKEFYEGSVIKIKIGPKLSRGFLTTKGLKQGCCISPTLFKIYVENALKEWKERCSDMGVKINGEVIYTLQFADDQVIIAEERENLVKMTEEIRNEYGKWGLTMNMNKTKYLCIGEDLSDLMIGGNEKVENCKQYRYLGIEIEKEGRDKIEIKNRIAQGRKAVKRLNSIWWSEEITRTRKYRIYNTIVKSILTYGCEAWRMTVKERRGVATVEMDALRRSCRISRSDRIRNEEIRRKMKIKETIEEEIQRRQLIWYGHVKRMEDNRIPRKTMLYKPTEKKKRGRPRRTWLDGIQNAMEFRGMEEGWSLDREKWKKFLEDGRRRQTPETVR